MPKNFPRSLKNMLMLFFWPEFLMWANFSGPKYLWFVPLQNTKHKTRPIWKRQPPSLQLVFYKCNLNKLNCPQYSDQNQYIQHLWSSPRIESTTKGNIPPLLPHFAKSMLSIWKSWPNFALKVGQCWKIHSRYWFLRIYRYSIFSREVKPRRL